MAWEIGHGVKAVDLQEPCAPSSLSKHRRVRGWSSGGTYRGSLAEHRLGNFCFYSRFPLEVLAAKQCGGGCTVGSTRVLALEVVHLPRRPSAETEILPVLHPDSSRVI